MIRLLLMIMTVCVAITIAVILWSAPLFVAYLLITQSLGG